MPEPVDNRHAERQASDVPVLGLRAPEAARAIGISQRKLSQLVAGKQIPFVKLGAALVFSVDELRQWLAAEARKQQVRR